MKQYRCRKQVSKHLIHPCIDAMRKSIRVECLKEAMKAAWEEIPELMSFNVNISEEEDANYYIFDMLISFEEGVELKC